LRAGIWAFLTAVVLAAPAQAYLTKVTVGLRIEAGFYCDYPTDGTEEAPHTQDGEVGLYDAPFPLVHLGDLIPAAPGVSVGIIVQLRSFAAGEELVVRARRIEDDVGPDVWQVDVGDDGRFWLGTSPDPGKALPYGHYEFAVFRGFTPLLVYEFQVLPVELVPEPKNPCHAQLS
jgi:hypothetical protein